jgi:hypothetical protein
MEALENSVKADSVQPSEELQKPRLTIKDLLSKIREWIGLIVTLTGLFSVLLYIAGRSFSAGYFAAMNIPSYQVNFSLWEYGEVGWFPMILFAIIMFATAGLFWGTLSYLLTWLGLLIKRLTNWLNQYISSPKIKLPAWLAKVVTWVRKTIKSIWEAIKPPPLSLFASISFLFLLISILILFPVLFMRSTLEHVYKIGEDNGRQMILEYSPQVELIAKEPIPLDETNFVTRATPNGLYQYQGFYLLTSNNGKYYLFRDIDRKTCKPVKVYIVESSSNTQVNFLPPTSLADQCDIKPKEFRWKFIVIRFS